MSTKKQKYLNKHVWQTKSQETALDLYVVCPCDVDTGLETRQMIQDKIGLSGFKLSFRSACLQPMLSQACHQHKDNLKVKICLCALNGGRAEKRKKIEDEIIELAEMPTTCYL